MQIKIENYQQLALDFGARLRDIRFVGQVVFVIIVLLISWSGVKTIQTNYNLQKQISALKQQNAVQQLQNNNLQLQKQYYNTSEYLDLSARQNFGLADSGEQEVLVPASVALSYAPPVNVSSPTAASPNPPNHQQNYQAWVNFFLHRPMTTN